MKKILLLAGVFLVTLGADWYEFQCVPRSILHGQLGYYGGGRDYPAVSGVSEWYQKVDYILIHLKDKPDDKEKEKFKRNKLTDQEAKTKKKDIFNIDETGVSE